MEDASLDDFFAKKDKSKKKSKSSKLTPVTPDNLVKTDEQVKKEKKAKKEKEKTQNAETDVNNIPKIIEEEWKEQEEEKEKDYSGLRIANIQISEEDHEEEEQTEEKEGEEDENGEVKEKKEQGPWQGAGAPPSVVQSTAVPVPQPVEESPKEGGEPAAAPKSTKYISPALRAAAAAGGGAAGGPTVPAHLRRKRAAPNLRSEDDFPTLGGGFVRGQTDSDPRLFEQVQYGGRQMEDPSKGSQQQLSLGNKYSALQD